MLQIHSVDFVVVFSAMSIVCEAYEHWVFRWMQSRWSFLYDLLNSGAVWQFIHWRMAFVQHYDQIGLFKMSNVLFVCSNYAFSFEIIAVGEFTFPNTCLLASVTLFSKCIKPVCVLVYHIFWASHKLMEEHSRWPYLKAVSICLSVCLSCVLKSVTA